MLFLVKIVRATNDNVASMYFNATGSLVSYFWIGFALCVFSVLCAILVMTIHESVIDVEEEPEVKDKSKEEESEKDTKIADKQSNLIQVV